MRWCRRLRRLVSLWWIGRRRCWMSGNRLSIGGWLMIFQLDRLRAGCRGHHLVGMLAYMQRTTVKLPDDLDARLRHEAKRRGVTISELTREAIETMLGHTPGRRRLIAAGAGASGQSDVSERIEEILASEVPSSH